MPHDLAVLVLVVLTGLVNLRVGIIVSIALLVLLESLFQFYFDRRLYRYLSALVWLTYPAYSCWPICSTGRVMSSFGSRPRLPMPGAAPSCLESLRLPVRMILEAKAKQAQTAPRP